MSARPAHMAWWMGLIGLSFGTATHAQTVEQWTGWGDAAMERGEHYGASRYYAGALEREPGRMALQWKQAEACRLSNQYRQAADLYERVYRKDQGRTYPDALRWLGEMQLCDERYDDAAATWRKVAQRGRKDPVLVERARHAQAGIELARAAASDTIRIEHLPGPVNSFDSEFGARIGPDGALYYTSLRGELNDDEEVLDTTAYHARLYRSLVEPGNWSEGVVVVDGHGADVANAAWTLTDGRLLFTRCADGTPCRIHGGTSAADGGPLGGLGEGLSTQPMVARWQGRELLFFVSDGPGGSGGTDIWQAELRDGEAVDVRPVAGPVNTPGNERCPWLDQRNGTLWFSSDFHYGLGGYDIFMAPPDADGFGTPVNAGAPLNSAANDLYPAIYPERGEGWITSNRKGSFAAKGETCCNDIYRFGMRPAGPPPPAVDTTVVAHLVALQQFQQGPPIALYFHNDEPEPRTRMRTTRKTYGATYAAYKVLRPTYESESGTAQAIRSFFQDEVDGGYNALMDLTEALRSALRNGEQITLEVRGHASPLAVNDYNQDLSQRRIASLRNHLYTTLDGELAAYMDSTATNGGILRLRALPFGEDRSVRGVSDDLADLRGSVYSVAAARERRIEIERIVVGPGPGAAPIAVEAGVLRQGVSITFDVQVPNGGAAPITITDTSTDCDCFVIEGPLPAIPPGGTGKLTLTFTGRSRPGPLSRRIMLHTREAPRPIELRISATVTE